MIQLTRIEISEVDLQSSNIESQRDQGDSCSSGDLSLASALARVLHDRFVIFHNKFIEITSRAGTHFLERDWKGQQSDSGKRLRLHTAEVLKTVKLCKDTFADAGILCDGYLDGGSLGELSVGSGFENHKDSYSTSVDNMRYVRYVWIEAQRQYVDLIAIRSDMEVAETFYNSVTRRLFNVVGIDRELEFIWLGPTVLPVTDSRTCEYYTFNVDVSTEATVREILKQCPIGDHFVDLDRDARLVADRIDDFCNSAWRGLEAIDVLKSVFYRNRGAYLIGRIRWLNRVSPCILPVLQDDTGVHVDAVLLTEASASRLFSFTRSYLHALSHKPSAVVAFLKSLLPVKPVAELYTALGYSQHGKTNMFRALYRHMEHSNTRFEQARGAAGMVMAVFTLPSFDVVFKVIKDRFPPVKKVTPEGVKRRYRLVFGYDRVGRLIDAQEFENLSFARDRFSQELLSELLRDCSRTVTVTDEKVIFSHMYTERRMYPLNLYLNEMAPERVREAVIDYGNAIKDLAAANIFPGDLFPKNFGVTRLGTVVFYDYDELALLSDINFRTMPPSRYEEDEMLDQPWFSVGPNDVFPEEFATFLRSPPIVEEVFTEHHPEITSVEFWHAMQKRHSMGDLPEFFPYHSSMRLHV